MTIHLLDTDEKPVQNSAVQTNCGVSAEFAPVPAQWADGRVCVACLTKHDQARAKYTFALPVSLKP